MQTFGSLKTEDGAFIDGIVQASESLLVRRLEKARSSQPFPNSEDLERALLPQLTSQGFLHHVRLTHPKTGTGFEYDYWHPARRLAMEIMGYRADDEIYKDILKFHVHEGTKVGVVWVPRWKWISGQRTETNSRATMKALAFAESYMAVEALVALVYDWVKDNDGLWRLTHVEPSAATLDAEL